jgi:hypothetical protein
MGRLFYILRAVDGCVVVERKAEMNQHNEHILWRYAETRQRERAEEAANARWPAAGWRLWTLAGAAAVLAALVLAFVMF